MAERVTVEVAVPVQGINGDDIEATFAAADRVVRAVGDAGERIDSGFGGGYREMGFRTDEPTEVIARARAEAPAGTRFGIREPLPPEVLRRYGLLDEEGAP